LLITGLALFLSTQGMAANLFQNPGFESPAISPITLGNGSTFLDGWTVSDAACFSNCVSIMDDSYTEGSLTFRSHSGNQWLDLTGENNSLTGGITQVVTLTPGQMYNLSFWVGNQDNASGAYPLPSRVQVFANGISLGVGENNDSLTNSATWKQVIFQFTPSATQNAITFQNATGLADNMAGLDDVYIDVAQTSVPEPSTVGTGGLALAALAFAATRRK
jgi:hypothetical protein